MKYFDLKNKLIYLIVILSAVFFIQGAAGDISFPASLDARNVCWSEPDIHEEQHSIPANRVSGHRGLQQFCGKPGLEQWFSNLHMSQNIYLTMFIGGIFLLFLFFSFLPSQFYDKLNITHKSDGKKRLL